MIDKSVESKIIYLESSEAKDVTKVLNSYSVGHYWSEHDHPDNIPMNSKAYKLTITVEEV